MRQLADAIADDLSNCDNVQMRTNTRCDSIGFDDAAGKAQVPYRRKLLPLNQNRSVLKYPMR